jgi:hypothetical protein
MTMTAGDTTDSVWSEVGRHQAVRADLGCDHRLGRPPF